MESTDCGSLLQCARVRERQAKCSIIRNALRAENISEFDLNGFTIKDLGRISVNEFGYEDDRTFGDEDQEQGSEYIN